LIDCPPSLGLLTLNALNAADGVIIPVQTQYLAYHGLHLLLDTISKTQKRNNTNLKITGIIPTIYDGRVKHDNEVLGELRKHYSHMLIDMPVPRRVAFADAMVASESIDTYDGNSDASKIFQKIAEVIDA
jgi:chromosome partitioning protein